MISDTAVTVKPGKALMALWSMVIAAVGALGGAVGGVTTKDASVSTRVAVLENENKNVTKELREIKESIKEMCSKLDDLRKGK